MATDGSDEAQLAARTAAELADKTASELHVIFVLPWPDETLRDLWGFDDKARQEAETKGRARLQELVEKMEASGGAVHEARFKVGRPEVRIISVAEEIGAGFIMMGRHGYGRIRRALMGSVSDYVVKHAHCPVTIIRD